MVEVGSDFSLSSIFCHLAHSFENSEIPEIELDHHFVIIQKCSRDKNELTDLYTLTFTLCDCTALC